MRERTKLLVLAACALPRFLALAVWAHPEPTLYRSLAESLADHLRLTLDGAAATHIEPFAPAVMAAGRAVLGGSGWAMLLGPILLASVAGVVLFTFTRAQTNSDRSAWITTILYALSPYLVRQSAALMEITVATALLILVTGRMREVRTIGHAVVAGLLFAAVLLTRFSFLPIAAGGILLIAFRGSVVRAAVATAVLLASLAPWMAYNHLVGGTYLPPRIGENLFESTNPWATEIVPRVNVDVLGSLADTLAREDLARQGITNPSMGQRDRALLDRTREFVHGHFGEAVWLRARNLGFVLQPRLLPFTERAGEARLVNGQLEIPPQIPRPLSAELVAGGFQALLLVAGALGIWRRRRHLGDDAFLLIVLGGVLIVNVVFFPTSRLLAPMTFVLMFYAGVAAGPKTGPTTTSAAAPRPR
jgi:4-amino-4-deoxy-L-arabinose transferase-like glycosyltransferase